MFVQSCYPSIVRLKIHIVYVYGKGVQKVPYRCWFGVHKSSTVLLEFSFVNIVYHNVPKMWENTEWKIHRIFIRLCPHVYILSGYARPQHYTVSLMHVIVIGKDLIWQWSDTGLHSSCVSEERITIILLPAGLLLHWCAMACCVSFCSLCIVSLSLWSVPICC